MTHDEDFGFSAVTEIPKETVKETTPIDLSSIEAKLEGIIRRLDNLELSSQNIEPDIYMKQKLKEVEDLVVPILQGLAENADKAYIHWPNRKPLLDEKIKQIYKLTRS